MSNIVGEWAEEAPVVSTHERVILMKLARHADNDGTGTYPAVATMARAALCDSRTVKRCLKAMRERGLIARGDQNRVAHIRRDRRPTVYDVLVPRSWYGQSWDKIMREREDNGREPIDPETRPDIASPAETGRAPRADKGVPNPKRSRPKKPAESAPTGGHTGGHTGGLAEVHDQGDPTGGHTDTPHGVTRRQGTGCLADTHGVTARHPNPSLNPSEGNPYSSPSSPPPDDAVSADDGVTQEAAEENPSNSPSQSDPNAAGGHGVTTAGGHYTPFGEPRGAVMTRFWNAVPSEIRPGAPKTRQALSDEIWPLFQEPCTWGSVEGGPELLADWFARQIPQTAIRSLPGWYRHQLEHRAPEGPVEDALVPLEECVCDENGLISERDEHGTERARRCPNRHLRSQDSASVLMRDPVIEGRIKESLASAPGIEQTPGTDELGASRLGDLPREAPEQDQVLPSGDVIPKF